MRRDHRSLAVEREVAARDNALLEAEIGELTARITEADTWAALLEARIAARRGARLTALWRRFATRCAVLFRSERVPNYTEGTPREGFEGLSGSKIRCAEGAGKRRTMTVPASMVQGALVPVQQRDQQDQ